MDWTAAAEKVGQEYQATLLEYCQLTGKVSIGAMGWAWQLHQL